MHGRIALFDARAIGNAGGASGEVANGSTPREDSMVLRTPSERTPARVRFSRTAEFLERFRAFRHMQGSDEFLALVRRREMELLNLFSRRRPPSLGLETL